MAALDGQVTGSVASVRLLPKAQRASAWPAAAVSCTMLLLGRR
jgi:hypothetical protein